MNVKPTTAPLPFVAITAPSDVCTCDPICNCYKGIPSGAALIALANQTIATAQRQIAALGTGKRDRKGIAALTKRVRGAGLMMRLEQLRSDFRAEYAR